MGLDQNWTLDSKENQDNRRHLYAAIEILPDEDSYDACKQVLLNESNKYDSTDLYYHRKVPSLQAFMEEQYYKAGGEGEFNLVSLNITNEILDELEIACKEDQLDTEATGFFWGHHNQEDVEDILIATNIAREALKTAKEGENVYYSAWY